MGEEYRAKVFKSGNSVALRLPKALGLTEGMEMRVREERGQFVMEPVPAPDDLIDLSGIYGAIPGIQRPLFDVEQRDWDASVQDG